ncbi:carbon-nitrogen hydrolase family protein [Pullulanibacillus sp. KACC 23026]|uniref:carbon-nitrogen hydrolase family protein n=1 Tax=Pullulanibacillus sp. KACC 23026 TaxID=3028315 RepID=UPI0023AE75AF|nr:carbon-nitrogen hydrolase family protein [Pullulanibacillus sp. KACC 23026]WEG11123.1 carbon-nitrogen hydrolase family protein [Pullulanibacillus sp. KACC 23026]
MSELKIALAQLESYDAKVEKNMARVEEVVKKYGASHDVIMFPETYLVGFPNREIARSLAEPLDGPIIRHIEEQAKDANTTIVVGFNEKDGANVYNTTVVIDPSGLVLAYRKTHLWVGEGANIDPGDRFKVALWKDTKIGVVICYDVEFPEPTRILANAGAKLLFCNSANMEPYGPIHRISAQARAQENQVFMAYVNRVGDHRFNDAIQFVGESAVIDPYGRVIAEARANEEEILSATIDLSQVEQSRQTYHYLNEHRIQYRTSEINEVRPGLWEVGISMKGGE